MYKNKKIFALGLGSADSIYIAAANDFCQYTVYHIYCQYIL
jgi:hypothetical protein